MTSAPLASILPHAPPPGALQSLEKFESPMGDQYCINMHMLVTRERMLHLQTFIQNK